MNGKKAVTRMCVDSAMAFNDLTLALRFGIKWLRKGRNPLHGLLCLALVACAGVSIAKTSKALDAFKNFNVRIPS
jgi:hypothetical protein